MTSPHLEHSRNPPRVTASEQKTLLSPRKWQGFQGLCARNWGQRPIYIFYDLAKDIYFLVVMCWCGSLGFSGAVFIHAPCLLSPSNTSLGLVRGRPSCFPSDRLCSGSAVLLGQVFCRSTHCAVLFLWSITCKYGSTIALGMFSCKYPMLWSCFSSKHVQRTLFWTMKVSITYTHLVGVHLGFFWRYLEEGN